MASKLPEPTERQKLLVDYEATIAAKGQAAQDAMHTVRLALLEVRDRELFKDAGYSSFKVYCQERWGMSTGSAYRAVAWAREWQAELETSARVQGRDQGVRAGPRADPRPPELSLREATRRQNRRAGRDDTQAPEVQPASPQAQGTSPRAAGSLPARGAQPPAPLDVSPAQL